MANERAGKIEKRQRLLHRAALSFKPSEAFTKQQEELQANLLKLQQRENPTAQREGADAYLDTQLSALDDSMQKVLFGAVTEMLKNNKNEPDLQPQVRNTMMGSVVKSTYFKPQYKFWKQAYEQLQKSHSTELKEHEYIGREAQKAVASHRDILIQARIESITSVELNPYREKPLEEEELKRLTEEVRTFITTHEKDLTSDKAKPETLKAIEEDFKKIFFEYGYNSEADTHLTTLFQNIREDLVYTTMIQKDIQIGVGVMIQATNLDLEDEEWGTFLQDGIDKLIQEEEEARKTTATIISSGSRNISGSQAVRQFSTESVQAIGSLSGVSFQPDPRGEGMFIVSSPAWGKSNPPRMRIQIPEGATDISEALYIIEDPMSDEDQANDKSFRAERTTTWTSAELPKALARMQLDYLLQESLKESGNTSTTIAEINAIIKDDTLTRWGERIHGFSFNERELKESELPLFKNLFTILANPNNEENLTVTVKKLDNLLKKDELIPYIQQILSRASSQKLTISQFIEMASARQDGIPINLPAEE